ncbi:MAG: hypothetical protein K0S75_746 [Clostridia bacterium]|nr:hypothetical protein [Clostridia bacterium]
MEKIILLVLFGIASSVFQAVVKNNKQKQTAASTEPMAGTKPLVGTKSMVGVQRIKSKVQTPNETKSNIDAGKDLDMYQERSSAEVPNHVVVPNIKEVPSSTSSFPWADDITIEDLQKSIIMAEILGKPKALKNSTR